MPAAAIAAVATVGSAVIGANASRSASNAQQRAADASIAEQQRQYDQTRQDQMPFLESGYKALDRLNAISRGDMSAFQTSPDYQFRLDQGTKNIGNSFAARGGAFSGNALRGLTAFNSGLASSEFGNWWDRQAGLANGGRNAASTVGAAGTNAANNTSNALLAQGDSRASGIQGQANAITSAIGGLSSIYGGYNSQQNALYDQLQPYTPVNGYRRP